MCEVVVFAIDLHTENDPYHPETKLFPPHNLEGTEGRKLYGSIQEIYRSQPSSAERSMDGQNPLQRLCRDESGDSSAIPEH